MKFRLREIAIAFTILYVVTSVFVHPYGNVRAARSSSALLPGVNADPAIAAVFERSCQNCHSDKTTWPWYSYVIPASVMIESDVARARSRMNLSHWDQYSPEEQEALLTAMSAMLRTRQMPPARYLLLHSDAKVSSEDIARVSQWIKAERQRLRTRPSLSDD